MRTLVVGAGAIGGYFGGRLLEAKRDVTFLVRPRRAAQLAEKGLRIKSRMGDLTIPAPPMTLAANLTTPFDLVLLSCKAYDLKDAIDSFAPAVGPQTAILPLLNGMCHLDDLTDRFGAERVLGGTCVIAATLNTEHEIVHLNDAHGLSFGEVDGTMSAPVESIRSLMEGARFVSRASSEILLDMWEKWVFLATLAGGTCLMRAAVGHIAAAPGGTDMVLRLFEECCAIGVAAGHAPREAFLDRTRAMLTAAGSPLTASMLRDIESGSPVEADHVIGDLLRRSDAHPVVLPIAFTHLKAYESRRQRTAS